MTTLSERLAEAARVTGKTSQAGLARFVGVKPPSVNGWFTGKTQSLEGANLMKASRYYGVRPEWLGEGKLPMFSTSTEAHGPRPVDILNNPDFPAIPLVKFKISAGVSGYEVGYLEPGNEPIAFRLDWFRSRGYDPARLYAIRVSGQSMETSLFEGDIVVVNTAATAPVDGEVFALNYDGEIVVKRTIRTAGTWMLASDNPDKRRYPDKPVHESVFVIGRIVHRQSERI